MRLWARSLAVFLIVLVVAASAQERVPKPSSFNLFSKEQDIQMGREYAAQVEKEMPIVRNAELEAWVARIGERLASQPEAAGYPYSFKIVQEGSINAFALPGGPTFVHTGLITSADNEAQVAGVLAHEIAHVALRHGTNQASKAQFWQLLGGVAGSALGSGSITGTLAQLGIGLGVNSVLLKYSRDAERDADILGARMMNAAGYNPIEMARFFEKLEAETGKGSKIGQFFSDHPNPGNRVRSVEEQIRFFPKSSYNASGNDISRMKDLIGRLPKIDKPQGGAVQAAGNPDPAASRPSNRLKQYQGGEVAFSYPENWEVLGQQGNAVTIAPRTAIFGQEIGYGLVADFFQGSKDLRGNTEDLINKMRESNSGLTVQGRARSLRVNGVPALLVTMRSKSPYNGANEVDSLLSIQRPGGVYHVVLVAPDSELNRVNSVFNEIIRSVRFSN